MPLQVQGSDRTKFEVHGSVKNRREVHSIATIETCVHLHVES